MRFFDKIMDNLNPSVNPEIEFAFKHQAEHLPTLWLLGKTGAGKSSLIKTITGDSKIEIGQGFCPCTLTSDSFDFPAEKPLLRFLDTRGLGEADYDAKEDMDACENRSHALVVVMKAGDPEQSCVLNALKQIRKSSSISQLLLVHTGVLLIADRTERQQCITNNKAQVKEAWNNKWDDVTVDFNLDNGGQFGIEELKNKLADILPIIAQINQSKQNSDVEEESFLLLRKEVLWYSGVASASDAIPGIGLFSVPAIQMKMLHSLGNQYGIEWNRRDMSEFLGTLGTSFGIQYAVKFGIRQGIKLIPAYGQTIGAAAATVMSFCTTYAIGRVACKYLYHRSKGEKVSEDEMKAMYKRAFESIKEVSVHEANNS